MALTKTRIAPTPSGYLHLGNVMSFLITASLARENGAKVLLRIDDIDRERVHKKFIEDIFRTLEFLEIPWDEGPRNYKDYKSEYSRFHRMEYYRKALDHLRNTGSVFACECSRRKLDRDSPDGSYPGTCQKKKLPFDDKEVSWRLYTPVQEIKLKEIAGRESSRLITPLLKDFVVRRKDGLPAYQLTSVVDDMLDKVDFIVRGKDLLGSSFAQVFLSKKLAGNPLKNVSFFHHTMMTDSKNRKMSKSSGATSIQHLVKSGMDKAGIYQMIGGFLKLDEQVNDFPGFQRAYIQQLHAAER